MRFLRRFRRDEFSLSSDASTSAKSAAILPGASDHELEKSEKRFGFWESLCGWAVAVGVALEYGPKFMVFLHDPTWENFRDLSGGLLIAIGVAGEVIFASFAAGKRDQLRDRNIKRVGELVLLAEQEGVARAKLERLTEKLRRKNKKMAVLFRDRNLRNRAKVIEAMRAFAGTKVYFPISPMYDSDPEAREFAAGLQTSLRDAGWRVAESQINRLVAVPPFAEGVHIEFPANDWYSDAPLSYVTAGCAVVDWLNRDKIATAIEAVPDKPQTETIIVKVGPKPSTLGMMKDLEFRGEWLFWRHVAQRPREYERISSEEVETVRALLAKANRSEGRLLKYAGARSVEDIRKRDLQRVIWTLESIVQRGAQ